MTKEETKQAIKKLLINIYEEDPIAVNTIEVAMLEDNTEVILDCIDATIDFMQELKKKLK